MPQFSKNFLYFYENKFMIELISNNKIENQHFHHRKWFIDDLSAKNDCNEFEHYLYKNLSKRTWTQSITTGHSCILLKSRLIW